MRTIKIETPCTFDSKFADKFIMAGHRPTSKTRPHGLVITFNNGHLSERRISKEVDYIIDLLYQAQIMKNDLTSLVVHIDKRNKEPIVIEVS